MAYTKEEHQLAELKKVNVFKPQCYEPLKHKGENFFYNKARNHNETCSRDDSF